MLDDIPNIGDSRRRELMKHYPGIEELKNAEIEELRQLPAMNERAAKSVYDFFHKAEET